MAEAYRVDVALTRLEVVRYNFFHIKWLLLIDIIGLGIFFYIVYASFSYPNSETREILRTISIWAAIALAVGFSQPLIIILQVFLSKTGKSEDLYGKRVYSFSDSGILIDSEDRTAEKDWSEILKVKRAAGILLIFTAPKLAYVIPRRCFETPAEWRGFIEYVYSHINRKK